MAFPVQHILVAEGDAAIRRFLKGALSDSGYTLDLFEDGAAALAAFDPARHHLLLLEHDLRDRTGAEVVRELRRRGVTVPVIVMSSEWSEAKSLLAGTEGVEYLAKPFVFPEVESKIRGFFRIV